jgi:hypothetical protein
MGQTLSEPVVDKVGARQPRPRTAVKTKTLHGTSRAHELRTRVYTPERC